jgi:hypothetical protein
MRLVQGRFSVVKPVFIAHVIYRILLKVQSLLQEFQLFFAANMLINSMKYQINHMQIE